MTGAIWELRPPEGLGAQSGGRTPAGRGGGFIDRLQDALLEVDRDQKAADAALVDFATGGSEDLHGVALAMKKAELSFRFMLAVRRKAIEAYQELTRLNV